VGGGIEEPNFPGTEFVVIAGKRASGRVVTLAGLYDNGHEEPSPRSEE